MGVDLGQSRDYTAMAVVERREGPGEWDAAQYAFRKRAELVVVYLERAPLGTSYGWVVARVKDVANQVAPVGVAIDATGLGRPVVDLVRAAGLRGRIWPVVLTGGETEREGDGVWRTPKRDLLVGMKVLMEKKEIGLAQGMKLGKALVEEFGRIRATWTRSGGVRIEGKGHDDLVVAVGLAVWGAKKKWGRKVSGDVGWWQAAE
jgi:hypothetical protein